MLVAFSSFSMVYYHHLCLVPIFIIPKKTPLPLNASSYSSSPFSPVTDSHPCPPSLGTISLGERGFHRTVALCVWVLSLGVIFASVSTVPFFLLYMIAPWHGYTALPAQQTGGDRVPPPSGYSAWAIADTCAPGVGLLGHVVILCLACWGAAKLCSKAAALFYVPPSKWTRLPTFPHSQRHVLLFVFKNSGWL